MIKSKLEDIASKVNGTYDSIESTSIYTDGSRSPNTEHKIQFFYNDCQIIILVNTGLQEMASINCYLTNRIRPVSFNIEVISSFTNLFLRRKSRFKVKCKNDNFRFFLKNKALKVFDEAMITKNFNPNIFSENDGYENRIIIEFHLAFSGWIDVFDEIILFLKIVIDELEVE